MTMVRTSSRYWLVGSALVLVFCAVGVGWWAQSSLTTTSEVTDMEENVVEDPLLRIVEPAEGHRIPRPQVYATLVSGMRAQQERIQVRLSGDAFESDRVVSVLGGQSIVSYPNLPDGTYTMTATPLGVGDQPVFSQTIVRHFVVDTGSAIGDVSDAEISGSLEELEAQGYEIVIDGIESIE